MMSAMSQSDPDAALRFLIAAAVKQRERTVARNSWLTAAGQEGTVELLLQFSGSFAVLSLKPSFNRRRLSFAPDRLLCSGFGQSRV